MIDDIRPAGTPPVQPQPDDPSEPANVTANEPPYETSAVETANPTPSPVQEAVVHAGGRRPSKKPLLLLVLLLCMAGAAGYWYWQHAGKHAATLPAAATSTAPAKLAQKASATGLALDTKKNYGNKYANGIVPVGDGKYQTSGAKQGYVYACSGYAQNLASDSGGAGKRGPWFSSDGTTYDLNKKTHVAGSVSWNASYSNTISGSIRTIATNDLPNHTTGVFPIAASDPAYAYDRNPNTISAQSFSYSLPVTPAYGNPQCIGGQVGVMTTGVALFSGFDAGGRDAGAWEVQDACSGHPEKTGAYHYHTLSSCIKDISVHTVIGYALDGFPITGPQVSQNNILTSSDLDACHGISSEIILDGRVVTLYHYVMTQDFPYSVSCFRAKAVQPPGQPAAGVRQHP